MVQNRGRRQRPERYGRQLLGRFLEGLPRGRSDDGCEGRGQNYFPHRSAEAAEGLRHEPWFGHGSEFYHYGRGYGRFEEAGDGQWQRAGERDAVPRLYATRPQVHT